MIYNGTSILQTHNIYREKCQFKVLLCIWIHTSLPKGSISRYVFHIVNRKLNSQSGAQLMNCYNYHIWSLSINILQLSMCSKYTEYTHLKWTHKPHISRNSLLMEWRTYLSPHSHCFLGIWYSNIPAQCLARKWEHTNVALWRYARYISEERIKYLYLLYK